MVKSTILRVFIRPWAQAFHVLRVRVLSVVTVLLWIAPATELSSEALGKVGLEEVNTLGLVGDLPTNSSLECRGPQRDTGHGVVQHVQGEHHQSSFC